MASALEKNDFSERDYVNEICKKTFLRQKQGFLDGDTPDPFTPESFLDVFKSALKGLDKLSGKTEKEMVQAQQEKEKAQNVYNNFLVQHSEEVKRNYQLFSQLEQNVYGIGDVAVRVGDQLQAVDNEKAKAKEARELLEKFIMLNSSDNVPSELRDKSDMLARVHLVKKLGNIINDLESEKTQKGRERVMHHTAKLKKYLFQVFDEAKAAKNYAEMTECARAFYAFNAGNELLLHYISGLAVFSEDPPVSVDLSNIDSFFASIKRSCDKEYRVIEKVFPSHERVMRQFVLTLFQPHQRVHMILRCALVPPSSQAKIGNWLIMLERCYVLCLDLVESTKQYRTGTDMNLLSLLDVLFSSYLSEYCDREEKHLSYLFKGWDKDLPTQAQQEELRTKGIDSTGVKVLSQDLILQSGEQVIEYIRHTKASLQRCVKVAKSDLVPQYAAKFFSVFAQYVGYLYMNSLLDMSILELKGLELATIARMDQAVTSPTQSRFSRPGQMDALKREEKFEELAFFSLSQQLSQNMLLIQQLFKSEILRCVENSESLKMQCVIEKQNLMSLLEGKVNQGLHKVFDIVSRRLEYILRNTQKKDEFKLDDPRKIGERTESCKKVLDFANRFVREMNSALDGLNLVRAQREFALRFYTSIIEHVKQQSISVGTGGMRLMTDMCEYKDFGMNCFKDDMARRRFEILRDVANIYVVPNDNLEVLINDSLLSDMERDDLLLLIRKRDESAPAPPKKQGLFSRWTGD